MMWSVSVAARMPPPQPQAHSPGAAKGMYLRICSLMAPMPISFPKSPMAMFNTPMARSRSQSASVFASSSVTSLPTALWYTPRALAPGASMEITAFGITWDRIASLCASACPASFVKGITPMLRGSSITVRTSL